MKNIDEQIEVCEARLHDFEETLKLMPADTVIGRLCMLSYIKREKKKLEKLYNQKNSQ